jgi:uncharacterized protein YukE
MFVGADTDQMTSAAQVLDQAASTIETRLIEIKGLADQLAWDGTDADSFRNDTATTQQGSGNAVAGLLRDCAQVLKKNAFDQEAVSGSLGGVSPPQSHGAAQTTGSGSPTPGPHAPRLASIESRAAVLSREGNYLRASGARSTFPGAFAGADEWLAKLKSGNPTPEEVQGFESYMAMLKLANMQRSAVRDAATLAVSEYVEMARSAGGAMGGASGMGDSPESVAKTIIGGMIDHGASVATDTAIDSVGGVEAGADALVERYTSQADDYLQSLLGEAKGSQIVGFARPIDLTNGANTVLSGRVDLVNITVDKAAAFEPFTGDGSTLDSGLRTAMKVVCPPAGKALDGLAIAGNSAQAVYHYQAATAALDIAMNGGMSSLQSSATALHLQ